jgi:hypothetical protein
MLETRRAFRAKSALERANIGFATYRQRALAVHASDLHFQSHFRRSLPPGDLPSKLIRFVNGKILALIGAR